MDGILLVAPMGNKHDHKAKVDVAKGKNKTGWIASQPRGMVVHVCFREGLLDHARKSSPSCSFVLACSSRPGIHTVFRLLFTRTRQLCTRDNLFAQPQAYLPKLRLVHMLPILFLPPFIASCTCPCSPCSCVWKLLWHHTCRFAWCLQVVRVETSCST